ncbi:uridine phosphorylase 1-like [Maniola hyperantus]|uniref:uridine phosphorylase 1-like n=1 Tax=Aphantopus hyperantus TaxID=2795564 RepID=UPI00156A3D19|nr:uridine phosphorylase 1-like [Maniola hyperantus]
MACDCDYILPTMDGWEQHYQNCSTVWFKEYGSEPPKNTDGSIRLRNKHLSRLHYDVLYHLGLDTENYDLPAMFGDVKFVCMGGTKYRMKEFAKYIAKVLKIPDEGLVNLTKHSHRYAMYKVGPVLSVNHGIGIPSMTILLQEVIKLLSYAKAKDPLIFRIGTSGGLNIPSGSVVVSSWGLNGTLKKSYDIPVMGKIMEIPSIFDKRLNQELLYLASKEEKFSTYTGGTMAADDFYQGQARLDGPFCDYTESDKLCFLNTLVEMGVKNIEMEATAFAAFTREAGVRAADVCVTLVNRLEQDQVTPSKSVLLEWQERPMMIIGKYISKYCEKLSSVH